MRPSKHTLHKKAPQLDLTVLAQYLNHSTAHCVYVLLACTAVLCAMFLLAITPQRYSLKVGDTITVTGIIENYNGKLEFGAKSNMDSRIPG